MKKRAMTVVFVATDAELAVLAKALADDAKRHTPVVGVARFDIPKIYKDIARQCWRAITPGENDDD